MKFYQRVHGVTDLEKRCDKCLEVVQTGGVILPGNSGLYHTECFRCKQCDKVINGKYSIAEGGGVICVNVRFILDHILYFSVNLLDSPLFFFYLFNFGIYLNRFFSVLVLGMSWMLIMEQ